MNARPDANAPSRVREFLSRSDRRRSALAAAQGASVGLAIGGAVAVVIALGGLVGSGGLSRLIAIDLGTAIVLVATGVWLALVRHRRDIPVAHSIEVGAPQCRNVVITAAELIDHPPRTPSEVVTLVCQEAATLLDSLDPARLFPARRALATLGITFGLYAVALFAVRPPGLSAAGAPGERAATAAATIGNIDITVTPPPYAARPAQSFHDPARIEALAGSVLRVAVHADAGTITLETVDGKRTPATAGQGQTFEATLVADADGYIALEPAASDGRVGIRRLIGVSVTPDLAPRVRLTMPGHDLLLPNGHRTIDIAVEGHDDIALATLRVRYTKVSGAGEQFTFTEADVPIQITRASPQQWTGHGALNLDSLKLDAGDMVVYRGIATDQRPGAPPSESDSYIVEIATPGSIPMEGFSADDRKDKYGISQQMVILKTEQLIARRKTLPPDTLENQMAVIAAEQRAVRAEFVFMMGGELAEEVVASAGLGDVNEVAEAEAEGDIAAGRLANQGRVDLVQAIRAMSQANTALNAADADVALVREKSALAFLLRAFSRTRYILRALTERERLDLSRRLTGVLSAVGRDVRPVEQPVEETRVTLLRRALAEVATASGTLHTRPGTEISASVSSLAQQVLQVDPGAEPLQQVASLLNDAADAAGKGRSTDAQSLLDKAAVALAAAVRVGLLEAPAQPAGLGIGQLDGALTDALRRAARGGGP